MFWVCGRNNYPSPSLMRPPAIRRSGCLGCGADQGRPVAEGRTEEGRKETLGARLVEDEEDRTGRPATFTLKAVRPLRGVRQQCPLFQANLLNGEFNEMAPTQHASTSGPIQTGIGCVKHACGAPAGMRSAALQARV